MRKIKASGIPKCENINITGHRHERGLDPYGSGDENEQRFQSNVIDKVPFVPVTQSSSSISLPSSAVPQNQFQQVQLQRNYAPVIAKQNNTSSQVLYVLEISCLSLSQTMLVLVILHSASTTAK